MQRGNKLIKSIDNIQFTETIRGLISKSIKDYLELSKEGGCLGRRVYYCQKYLIKWDLFKTTHFLPCKTVKGKQTNHRLRKYLVINVWYNTCIGNKELLKFNEKISNSIKNEQRNVRVHQRNYTDTKISMENAPHQSIKEIKRLISLI